MLTLIEETFHKRKANSLVKNAEKLQLVVIA